VLRPAWQDIKSTFYQYHVITTLAWQDIAARYKRSRVGAFWLTIGMAVTIGALGFVFGNLFDQPMNEFLPYLSIGMILWNFFNIAIAEGGNSFVIATDIILQVRIPLFIHVMRVLWRNIIILGHNILILPIVYLIYLRPVTQTIFLIIPGFLLLVMNVIWIMLILSVVCARFRDFPQIVQNVLQIMYFVTPIMWNSKMLPERVGTLMLDLNPCYHLLNIVRAPMLGETPSELSWIFSISMMIVGWVIAIVLFGRYRNRIPYWL
jgi:ABC-type polysaccharide/polyol phosphate export permease